MKTRSRWLSPYLVMGVVLAMYGLKVALKLFWIGPAINSPTITGDGAHNVADLIEVFLVMAAVAISRMEPDERYPFGRKNVESIIRAAIGVGLLLTALHFAATSIMGLLAYAPDAERTLREAAPFALPDPPPLRMGGDVVWWVLAVTGGSALLSVVVSAYEISAGKVGGHPSMVADGLETRSDAMIEATIFTGICLEYGFGAAWLEYPFGLGVAFLVAKTGRELLTGGLDGLLQRSLGTKVEQAIREVCLSNHGVREVEQVKTFRVGNGAVCILKILTDAPAAAHDDVKKALKKRLAARLAELEIEEVEYHLRFSRLPPADVRVAYAAVTDGTAIAVVSEIAQATHFIICDRRVGGVKRWTLEEPPAACEGRVLDWLIAKRVTVLYVFGDRQPTSLGPIQVSGVPSYNLRTLGLLEPPAI